MLQVVGLHLRLATALLQFYAGLVRAVTLEGATGKFFRSSQAILQGCAFSNLLQIIVGTLWQLWVEAESPCLAYCYADDWYFLCDRYALRGPPGSTEAKQAEGLRAKLDARKGVGPGSKTEAGGDDDEAATEGGDTEEDEEEEDDDDDNDWEEGPDRSYSPCCTQVRSGTPSPSPGGDPFRMGRLRSPLPYGRDRTPTT